MTPRRARRGGTRSGARAAAGRVRAWASAVNGSGPRGATSGRWAHTDAWRADRASPEDRFGVQGRGVSRSAKTFRGRGVSGTQVQSAATCRVAGRERYARSDTGAAAESGAAEPDAASVEGEGKWVQGGTRWGSRASLSFRYLHRRCPASSVPTRVNRPRFGSMPDPRAPPSVHSDGCHHYRRRRRSGALGLPAFAFTAGPRARSTHRGATKGRRQTWSVPDDVPLDLG